MTKITLETTSLADVIKRAAAIAPTRGDAFDKTAGVILQINALASTVTVMATDTSVFYMENMSVVGLEGDSTTWRVPSQIFAGITGKLPMGSGNQVTMDDQVPGKFNKIVLRCNKLVAELNKLDMAHYPLWSAVDTSTLTPVQNFGAAVKQVMWAASNTGTTLAGVALFPDSVCATDRFRMARVELDTGLVETLVIPGKILAKVLPDNGEVSIGHVGTNFMISPNEWTQIRTVTGADPYPNVAAVLGRQFDATSHFGKTEFMNMLNRSMDFTGGSREASVSMFLGKGEVALHMDNREVGLFGDLVDASGDAENHKRIKIIFLPENLRDAVAVFPGEVITMKYNLDRTAEARKLAVSFTNEANYNSLIQPMRPPTEAKES